MHSGRDMRSGVLSRAQRICAEDSSTRHRSAAAAATACPEYSRRSVAAKALPSRRDVLRAPLAAAGLELIAPQAAGAAALANPFAVDATQWLSSPPDRALVSNPGLSWAVSNVDRQQYYPAWLEGIWDVQARLAQVGFPQGQRLVNRDTPGVTKGSLITAMGDVGAGMDAPVMWQWRFMRQASEGKVVADRVFNITQQLNATLGYTAVRQVEYAPEQNPTRLAVVWVTPRRGAGAQADSVDVRKAEVFINNRDLQPIQASSLLPTQDRLAQDQSPVGGFIAWEMYRQVNQAARQGSVGDYLVIVKLTPVVEPSSSGQIEAVDGSMRIAAFLQPQDAAYFESGGKAVACYDYDIRLKRARSCVYG